MPLEPHSSHPEGTIYTARSNIPDIVHGEFDIDPQTHDFDDERPSMYTSRPWEHGITVPEYNPATASAKKWAANIVKDPVSKTRDYLVSFFPIAKWILHYNWKWGYNDLIAGITVGVVLVPQSMSYAQLAGLPPQYGLYSSFVGVFIYSIFATSKDVSIGPVAVMSLQVSKVIASVQASSGAKYSAPEIATFLSLICGGVATAIGILRIGFILEFISIPAVMGFMSGSAFSIITGQVPALLGYKKKVNTSQAAYKVVIDTLKNLKFTTVDAIFGLVPLLILYLWKFGADYAQKRWPRKKAYFFYFQQLRNAIVIIVATAICWGIVHPKKVAYTGPKFVPSIQVIGKVPRGLQNVGVMKIPEGIIGHMASELPVSIIVLLLEHIAIAKSFGRVNDYKIVPDQEVIAIGVTNLIGTFFNAYPATGSFSRSALKAKCGVRTPFAGIFTGGVVLLALYALTETFYYIPTATLSAVIIHAVSDLLARYTVTLNFWKIAPFDAGIFVIAVIITVFASIEVGIYFAICASAAVLLFRIARPAGHFLGRVQVAEVINPLIEVQDTYSYPSSLEASDESSTSGDIEIQDVLSDGLDHDHKRSEKKASPMQLTQSAQDLQKKYPKLKFHTRWVPLNKNSINEHLIVEPPPPGVLVFKPLESLVYPNASYQVDRISDEARLLTRRGKPYTFGSAGSRPWNDPGPLKLKLKFWEKDKHDEVQDTVDERPLLRIVHIDMLCATSIDVSSVQALVDLRKALNNYADREVEFHFSGILSPWIRRALLNAGFGNYAEEGLVSESTYVDIATQYDDLELAGPAPYLAAVSTQTPFFHLDIPDYR